MEKTNTYDYIINKYKINVGKQYLIDIPELVGGAGLVELFAEMQFNFGVEIGTDQGLFAEYMCQVNPKLHLYCVDPWMADAYEEGKSGVVEDQDYFDARYEETAKRLEPYNCTLFRKTSMDALEFFDDNSLDFVYIDGNHDFLNIAQDMHFWLKKIRPGGILSGHDFVRYPSRKFNHVQKVVNAYTQSYHLLPVFLPIPTDKGLKRDKFRSWFVVKP